MVFCSFFPLSSLHSPPPRFHTWIWFVLFHIDLYVIIPNTLQTVFFFFLPCFLGFAWPTRWKRWKWGCGPHGEFSSPLIILAINIIHVILSFLRSSPSDKLLLNCLPGHETCFCIVSYLWDLFCIPESFSSSLRWRFT